MDSFRSKRVLLTCLVLIAASVIVYAPVRHFGFVNMDDPEYVTDNPHVAQGLTWQGAQWALTSSDAANWHPVTWLSHMLDVQLFGMNAGPQHVTNLILHILNALLLFGLLYRMTGAWGRSAFVAGLFALHPLHVESVAWISERKDVLSTLFGLLAMWAYVAYARRPGPWRYVLVVLWFGLGLMAKPMLVTLPFVLLLLDFWPLQRAELGRGGAGLAGLAREKVPLFALAALSSVVTVLAQRQGGAVAGLGGVSLSLRLANALASYAAYIGNMLWPVRLAAYYPLATSAPVMQACLGAVLLIGVTALAIRTRRRHGYFLVGWLWYVGTLIPVIGLVQVGSQSMADRYTYLPLIGLFLIAAWGAPELAARWPQRGPALTVAGACLLLACASLASTQVQYWSDDAALWQHALDVTSGNYFAHNNLGETLIKQGRTIEAAAQFAEAVRLRPRYAHAQNNLGMALVGEGQLDAAALRFREALHIDPNYAYAHDNLGMVLIRQRKLDEATQHISEALRIKPDFPEAQSNLGTILMVQGRLDEAARRFTEALRAKPDYVEALNNLGMVLIRQGKFDEAAQRLGEALRIKPNYAEAHANLGMALMSQGKLKEADQQFSEATRIKPELAPAIEGLKSSLAALRKGGQ